MNFVLKNEHTTVTIRSLGAELISMVNEDIEYIWQRDPYYWYRCAPVLFPIVGNLRDKKTIINDQIYYMTIHGFLKDQEFELLHQTEKEISLVNTYNEDTLKLYPFKYKAIITYTLNDLSLRTTFTIYNENDIDMPFNIGGHPAINCPLFENEKFSDYSIHFSESETFVSPKIEDNGTINFDEEARRYEELKTLNLERSLFDIDTIIIPRVKSKEVKLLNKVGKGIKFAFNNFLTFAIWSPYPKEAPFVCLEPWVGYGDRYDTNHQFLNKDNLIILKSLEQFSAYYDIEIVK